MYWWRWKSGKAIMPSIPTPSVLTWCVEVSNGMLSIKPRTIVLCSTFQSQKDSISLYGAWVRLKGLSEMRKRKYDGISLEYGDESSHVTTRERIAISGWNCQINIRQSVIYYVHEHGNERRFANTQESAVKIQPVGNLHSLIFSPTPRKKRLPIARATETEGMRATEFCQMSAVKASHCASPIEIAEPTERA